MFNQELVLSHMEKLLYPEYVFAAGETEDHDFVWLRDHLYMAFSYWYLGRKYHWKLVRCIQSVFDIFHKYRYKLERVVYPRDREGNLHLIVHELIHAKYDKRTLNEVINDWGHHQLDSIGLFLHIVADLSFKHIKVVRNRSDREILQLLVFYLQNVEYWHHPDNGMWEECFIQHSSSIGAVVSGLSYIHRRGLAVVPHELIARGRNELKQILPFESRDTCPDSRHSHLCDVAQLFLIWPFNVAEEVEDGMTQLILKRVLKGFETGKGDTYCLVKPNGINRYFGDHYLRSADDSAAEWQWDFLVSIIFSQRHDYDEAVKWFMRGAKRITKEGYVAEAYCNGKHNNHTPLGWMQALALIAYHKLPVELQESVQQET